MTFYVTHNMVFDLCNTGNIVKDFIRKIQQDNELQTLIS